MGWFSDKNKKKDDEPEDVAQKSNDAYCDVCRTWYDLNNDKEFNRHAH